MENSKENIVMVYSQLLGQSWLCCVYRRLTGPAYATNLSDKPCFEQKDDGKVDEHPSYEKEFSIKLMEGRGQGSPTVDSSYKNSYNSKDVDEKCSSCSHSNVDYLSDSGYTGAPEKQHNHERV